MENISKLIHSLDHIYAITNVLKRDILMLNNYLNYRKYNNYIDYVSKYIYVNLNTILSVSNNNIHNESFYEK